VRVRFPSPAHSRGPPVRRKRGPGGLRISAWGATPPRPPRCGGRPGVLVALVCWLPWCAGRGWLPWCPGVLVALGVLVSWCPFGVLGFWGGGWLLCQALGVTRMPALIRISSIVSTAASTAEKRRIFPVRRRPGSKAAIRAASRPGDGKGDQHDRVVGPQGENVGGVVEREDQCGYAEHHATNAGSAESWRRRCAW